MRFIKKHKEIFVLTILAIVFFFVYSYLPISQVKWQYDNHITNISLRFNTPDEVINYYFTSQYAETGELYYFEPLDRFMNRVIFPRWALVVNGKITPGNFLGIDLIYGTLAKVFSPEQPESVIPFLTPLFAVIGVLFFYLLIKLFFEKRVAFVSALLIFVFPGFWYYSSRTMFHNILFLSLLIISLYFLLRLMRGNDYNAEEHGILRGKTRKGLLVLSVLTGLFFGLALITRTSEIVWVFLAVLAILIFYRKNLKSLWPYLLVSLAIFISCFVPIMYHNKILYDNYFSTGYPLTTVSTNLESGQVGSISFLRALILPFGFDLENIATYAFYNYILKLFWPWLILWFVGLLVFLKQKNKTKERKLCLIVLLIVNCYLLIYYGSWFFYDALDPDLISLGSSYVRYFLPLFVFNIPLIAFLLVKLSQYLKRKNRIIFTGYWLLVTGCFLIFSAYQVLFQGPESLTAIKRQLIKYQTQAQDLFQYIGKGDIILTDIGTDKILFPERKHLIVPQGGVEWPEIQKIIFYKNVYYFHHSEKVSRGYLNKVKFNPHNLELEDGVLINGGGKLYKIKYQK